MLSFAHHILFRSPVVKCPFVPPLSFFAESSKACLALLQMRDATEAAYRGPAIGPAVSRDQLSPADTAVLSGSRPSWPAVGRPRPSQPLENSLHGQAGELALAIGICVRSMPTEIPIEAFCLKNTYPDGYL